MAAPVRADLFVAALRRAVRTAAANTTGSVAIEYGLIASLVSIAIVAGVIALGSTLGEYFDAFASYF